jgi:hypothetical protein
MAGFSLRTDVSEEEQRAGIWTAYGAEPTDEERRRGIKQEAFKIRPLTPKDFNHFDKMAMERRWENHQRVEAPNQERRNELLYDYAIEDWEGIYLDDAKTQPAPCTLQYKMLLAGKSLDRDNFIIMQGSLYANDDAAREKAQRDNFRQADSLPIGLQTS